jgi:hypothetical protein
VRQTATDLIHLASFFRVLAHFLAKIDSIDPRLVSYRASQLSSGPVQRGRCLLRWHSRSDSGLTVEYGPGREAEEQRQTRAKEGRFLSSASSTISL